MSDDLKTYRGKMSIQNKTKNNKQEKSKFDRMSGSFINLGFSLMFLFIIVLTTIQYVGASPSGPIVTFISNTTYTSTVPNRSIDAKGTITTLTMAATQQDYKWKAYVGNVSGGLTLDDAGGKAIYDWTLSTITGEVYVTRATSVNWASIGCANQSIIDSEQGLLGMNPSGQDSINRTFNNTLHKTFLVGTTNITASSCRSTATYINGAAQTVDPNAFFQEILLKDNVTSSMIYTGLIDYHHASYNNVTQYDFQMIVAENETAPSPLNYYFYVELG